MRIKYLTIVLSLVCAISVQAQTLDVKSFAVKANDITARTQPRQDNNGNACALVKVRLASSGANFDGNVIGKVSYNTSEYLVYMAQGSKRLTVKLEGYLPLEVTFEDFGITRLESKTVYILELQLPLYKVSDNVEMSKMNGIYPNPNQPIVSVPVSATPQPNPSGFHIYLGVGFNAISAMGPSVHLGASYRKFYLEAGYVLGLDKVENLTFTQPDATSPIEAYDYSCSKFWVRDGYSFGEEKFRVSTQAGVTFNMISGKEVSGISNSSNYFKESNPIGAFAAIRLSYGVTDHLWLHLTPQYDFSIGGDQVFEVIKQADSKIKAWGEGFGINAGIIYEF